MTGSADSLTGYDLAKTNKGQSDGMSLQDLENILSDIRYQPVWRGEADKCADYYDSHQLSSERLEKMGRLGIPPLITNLIAPVVNSVLGLEAKNRTDARVSEADEAQQAPPEIILAMNQRLNEVERKSLADIATSEAYAAQIKAGVGWVEVGRESDPSLFPYRIQYVHRNEIWWDWRSSRADYLDMRYLVRKRRYDKDHLIAIMPEHEKLIRYAVEGRFGEWNHDMEYLGDTDLAYADHIERITNIDATDWRDAERGRATVYETWYRTWKRSKFFDTPSGKLVLVDKKNPRHAEAIRNGLAPVVDRVHSDVRVSFFLGCHRLYDMPSPYSHKHFPYVPFFGYKEDRSGIRYGIIRNMLSPQDMVNSADAKMHMLLNSKRVIADSDAIDTRYNTWRDIRDEAASTDSLMLLDGSRPNARFEIQSDTPLNAQQFQRRMQAASDIENAGGVYKAMLGKEGAATSGVGINSLIEQSTVMLSEITDNYSLSRRMVRELLFELIKEDIVEREIAVPIKKDGKKMVVILNQRVVDQATGEQRIENDVTGVEFKVAMNEVPNTASFKQQQLKALTDALSGLPDDVRVLAVPTILELTDAPDREELAEEVRKRSGIGPKLTEEQQAAQDQQAQAQAAKIAALQERVAVASAEFAEARVSKENASTGKIDAERIAKMIESMYSAMQSGQVVASMPQVAPIADALLDEAGFPQASVPRPDNVAVPSQVGGQPVNMQPGAEQAPEEQLQPQQPQSPAIGQQHGIETMRNDGVGQLPPDTGVIV